MESIKKSGAEVAQDTANGRSTVSKFWQFPKNVKDAVTVVKSSMKVEEFADTDLFAQTISQYTNDVLSAQQTEKNLAVLSNVQQVTPAFTVL